MSVAPIPAGNIAQYILESSLLTDLNQLLQALEPSLSSGDLATAQAVLRALLLANPKLAAANAQNPPQCTPQAARLIADLRELTTAIASGDLAGTRQAVATLKEALSSPQLPAPIRFMTLPRPPGPFIQDHVDLTLLHEAPPTSLASLPAGNIAQYISESSLLADLQQLLQALKPSLLSGDLAAAQAALHALLEAHPELAAFAEQSQSPGLQPTPTQASPPALPQDTPQTTQLLADLRELTTALTSGDVAGARQALAMLKEALSGAAANTTQRIPESSLLADLQQLLQALEPGLSSGDLAEAQAALHALLQANPELAAAAGQPPPPDLPQSPTQALPPALPQNTPQAAQLLGDLRELTTALTSGDLTGAQQTPAMLKEAPGNVEPPALVRAMPLTHPPGDVIPEHVQEHVQEHVDPTLPQKVSPMSIAPILPGNIAQYTLESSLLADLHQLLQALEPGLSSGDLAAAQAVLHALLQANPKLAAAVAQSAPQLPLQQPPAPASPQGPPQGAQLIADLRELTTALASGDLAGARQALATLDKALSNGQLPALLRAMALTRSPGAIIEDRVDLTGATNTLQTSPNLLMQALATAYGVQNTFGRRTDLDEDEEPRRKSRKRHPEKEDESEEGEENKSEDSHGNAETESSH